MINNYEEFKKGFHELSEFEIRMFAYSLPGTYYFRDDIINKGIHIANVVSDFYTVHDLENIEHTIDLIPFVSAIKSYIPNIDLTVEELKNSKENYLEKICILNKDNPNFTEEFLMLMEDCKYVTSYKVAELQIYYIKSRISTLKIDTFEKFELTQRLDKANNELLNTLTKEEKKLADQMLNSIECWSIFYIIAGIERKNPNPNNFRIEKNEHGTYNFYIFDRLMSVSKFLINEKLANYLNYYLLGNCYSNYHEFVKAGLIEEVLIR